MTQRFFVDTNGNFLGSYEGPDGSNPFIGETEVGSAPEDARSTWNGTAWVDYLPSVLELKEEANRRIIESGHDWMAIREISDGTPIPQTIKDYAAAIRADCAALELSPVSDYKNDTHWTAAP